MYNDKLYFGIYTYYIGTFNRESWTRSDFLACNVTVIYVYLQFSNKLRFRPNIWYFSAHVLHIFAFAFAIWKTKKTSKYLCVYPKTYSSFSSFFSSLNYFVIWLEISVPNDKFNCTTFITHLCITICTNCMCVCLCVLKLFPSNKIASKWVLWELIFNLNNFLAHIQKNFFFLSILNA